MSSFTMDHKINIVGVHDSENSQGARQILQFFGCFYNKTIIPLSLVEYEIVIANLMLHASLAIYHLISNTHL